MSGERRIEIRDGREYQVVTLPDAPPPARRSGRSRYRMKDVGKAGDEAVPKRRRRSRRRAVR